MKAWANRIGVSVPTLQRLEAGDPSVAIGIVATALWLIRREGELAKLAAPETVNTMPEKTLEATFDHGPIHGDAVTGTFDDARATIASIEALGISLNDVTELLEREGVDKFIVSWNELLDIVTAALDSAR